MVDKNLFLHDLAIVAIFKNEGKYLKEWLDYHLLAGVDHFYLYDNDSTDEGKEILAPYVEIGLVDYFFAPGKVMQIAVYNDAVKRFKFFCRYMAFIDIDEFIYLKNDSGGGIVSVVDEILSKNSNAAGLGINWQLFGSNGEVTADYSRGVLERFTRRAPKDWVVPLKPSNTPGGNAHVKTISNPRKISFILNPHFAIYFKGFYSVNEINREVKIHFNFPVTVEKIAINHYYTKSREEYLKKVQRGRSDVLINTHNIKYFDDFDHNEEFDDCILKYRAVRSENFIVESLEEKIQRVTDALIEKLLKYASDEFSEGELETALTCLSLSTYLSEKYPSKDSSFWRNCQESSLRAILKSLENINPSEAQLLILELPNLWNLPYPVVKEIRKGSLCIIRQMIDLMRIKCDFYKFVELSYLLDILKER